MKIFSINPSAYMQIKEHLAHPGGAKKIAAIKLLRLETKAGLKEAKEAIEKMQHEEFGGNYPHASKVAHKIIVGPLIKRLVIDYGTGEFEVDIETLELKALMEMQTIGLERCGEILELVSALKAFSLGKKIKVDDESG
jgi:hypothetical protein